MAAPPPPRRPTAWIVLTAGLGVAVLGLAIWAIVLQRDKDDAETAGAARIQELEQENADLREQIPGFEQQIADL